MKTRSAAAPLLLLLALGLLAGCGQGGNESVVEITGSAPSDGRTGNGQGGMGETGGTDDESPATGDGTPDVVTTAATGLDTPWGVDFLPDGRAVVTERDTARVLLISPPDGDEPGEVVEVGTVPDVVAVGEAGLLGVAVSPTFEKDDLVYFYVCTEEDNRVVRAKLRKDELGEVRPILTGIPNGQIHDGGRLLFGPDGMLYVSTGETGEESLARDRSSYAGKILRITPDGKMAKGNPFGTTIWSWGHRNIEGLAFDDRDQLWATEFGENKADELNLIEAGADHGWPIVEGDSNERGFAAPVLTWSVEEASPAGIAYSEGYLWMAALRGERLWRITVDGPTASDPTGFLEGEYGRLRTVVVAPDGMLWLTTSNQDGRGDPAEGDDRILVVDP